METTDFEEILDKEILPNIKKQLLAAYVDGYKQASIDDYVKNHPRISGKLIDFGLPSGTIWIVRMELYTFREAKEMGLQFPSKEQIKELLKCKWRSEQYDCWHCHVKGPNGYETGIFDSCHQELCVWTEESIENEDFMVNGYVYNHKEKTLLEKMVYCGEKFSTLFVLPKELQK